MLAKSSLLTLAVVAAAPAASADTARTADHDTAARYTVAQSEPPAVRPAEASAQASVARTDDAPTARTFSPIGGHLGMALPIITLGQTTTTIGSDFATIGLTPGITVHLDERWAIDFEFIAFNEIKNTPAATTFIVDPGVLRKFDGFVAGLRVATQVGAPTNIGLVPILVLPFKISDRVSWFVEGDLPLFLRDDGTQMRPSATFLFQTGAGF